MVDALPCDAYHLNTKMTNGWQEYDCPRCGIDFDVEPIPEPGEMVRCLCGAKWLAGEHEPNTYVRDADGTARCVEWPITT